MPKRIGFIGVVLFLLLIFGSFFSFSSFSTRVQAQTPAGPCFSRGDSCSEGIYKCTGNFTTKAACMEALNNTAPPFTTMTACIQSGRTQQECSDACWASGAGSEAMCQGSARSAAANIVEVKDRNESLKAAVVDGKANLGDLSVKTLTYSLTEFGCMLGGEKISCDKYDETGKLVSNPGVYSQLASLVGQIYQNPPANTQMYVADVMQDLKMGVAQPAYAQGIGFSALNPILQVWKTLRNIAYFFFVIIFVVIGFMIMFRQKISGQAVVTAQQAIPNIIVALLLVTFSYAIAGLLIDMMYLIMFLIGGLFGKMNLIDGNVFQITGQLITGGAATDGANAVGKFVESALGGGVVGTIASWLGSISAAIIILIVLVFNAFKLFFGLLKTYVELIINIAFAPIVLMMGAIPGNNPVGPWLKNIIGNLAVFPVILCLLVIYDTLQKATIGSAAGGGFLPPYTAGFADPSVIPFLAGLAMILALPQAVDETKKAFGVSQSGMFAALMQAGVKNAMDQRKRATGIMGAGAAAIGGSALGAGAGYLLSKKDPNTGVRKNALRNTLIGGTIGAGAPVISYVGGKGVSLLGKGVDVTNRYGRFAAGLMGNQALISAALGGKGVPPTELDQQREQMRADEAARAQESDAPKTKPGGKGRSDSALG